MLPIRAKTVYVDPEVCERENCRVRLECVLPFVDCRDIREYDEAGRAEYAQIGKRRHGKDDFGDDAVLVFTTFEPDRMGWYYHWRNEAGAHGGVCQPAMELNLVNGCVFRCAYCGFGRSIHFSLDVEQFMDGLDGAFSQYPDQRLYKYSNMTDLPPFEPELDAVPPMVCRFAEESDRYLMLFTKSDNVDFLLDLPHKGHTIISWSLSSDQVSREVDRRTATMQQRIAAMKKAQEVGYLVRARLSPIVPVKNWREEYEALFEQLYDQVDPDVVTLELLGWMGFEDLDAILDREMLDDEMVKEAERAVEEVRAYRWGPFTQRAHEEVYQFCIETSKRMSPRTPISVCHGTTETWKQLGPAMGMVPENYVCNCGPLSTPGGVLYDGLHAVG